MARSHGKDCDSELKEEQSQELTRADGDYKLSILKQNLYLLQSSMLMMSA